MSAHLAAAPPRRTRVCLADARAWRLLAVLDDLAARGAALPSLPVLATRAQIAASHPEAVLDTLLRALAVQGTLREWRGAPLRGRVPRAILLCHSGAVLRSTDAPAVIPWP